MCRHHTRVCSTLWRERHCLIVAMGRSVWKALKWDGNHSTGKFQSTQYLIYHRTAFRTLDALLIFKDCKSSHKKAVYVSSFERSEDLTSLWDTVPGSWEFAAPLERTWALQVIRVPHSSFGSVLYLPDNFRHLNLTPLLYTCALTRTTEVQGWLKKLPVQPGSSHCLTHTGSRLNLVTKEIITKSPIQKANISLRGPYCKLFTSQMRKLRPRENKLPSVDSSAITSKCSLWSGCPFMAPESWIIFGNER